MTIATRHRDVMEYMEAGYDFDDIENVDPELYEAWIDDQQIILELHFLEEFQRRQPAWNHALLIGGCGGAVVSESDDA